MNKPALKYVMLEEYLAREEAAKNKSEYYHGEIFAMAGASLEHNQIASNSVSRSRRTFLYRREKSLGFSGIQ